jgi:hypothetical protein
MSNQDDTTHAPKLDEKAQPTADALAEDESRPSDKERIHHLEQAIARLIFNARQVTCTVKGMDGIIIPLQRAVDDAAPLIGWHDRTARAEGRMNTEKEIEALKKVGQTVIGTMERDGETFVVIQCETCGWPRVADYGCDTCRARSVDAKVVRMKAALDSISANAAQAIL